jgi:hypothetical protein
METKIETLLVYLGARMSEPETWRGFAVIGSLIGGQYATLNWGECAALGAIVSGVMKIIFPTIVVSKG